MDIGEARPYLPKQPSIHGRLERGERNLALQSVERLVEGLGVPLIDLLKYQNTPNTVKVNE